MSVGDPMETIASVKVDSNTTSVNFTGLTNPIEGKYYQSYMLFCRHIASSANEAKLHINSTSNQTDMYDCSGLHTSYNTTYTFGGTWNYSGKYAFFPFLYGSLVAHKTYFLQIWFPHATQTLNLTTQGGGKQVMSRGIVPDTTYAYGFSMAGKYHSASTISNICIDAPIAAGSEYSLQGLPYA